MRFTRSLVFTLALIASSISVGSADVYKKSGEIKIGGKGGWDYLTTDAGNRLYMSQATRSVVIDTDTDKIIGEIKETTGVHGFALAPELGLGFITCGKEAKVAVFDLKTLKITNKIPVGENPDALVYDPATKKVFVYNGKSGSMSVIQAESKMVISTISLPGKPEFSAVDSEARRVYLNIEDKNETVAIDTSTNQIVSTWKTDPCDSPSGMAIDLEDKKLFSVCENKKMISMDTKTGKIVSSIAIGSGADAVVYDPSDRKVFASAGEGMVTIAHVDTQGKLTLDQTLETAPRSRTIAISKSTHKIYLPTAEFEPLKPGEKRPKIVNGSVKLLIYAPRVDQ
jgi:YVTN family beta-propeller protein